MTAEMMGNAGILSQMKICQDAILTKWRNPADMEEICVDDAGWESRWIYLKNQYLEILCTSL